MCAVSGSVVITLIGLTDDWLIIGCVGAGGTLLSIESIPNDSNAETTSEYPSRGYVIVQNPKGCSEGCGGSEGVGAITLGSMSLEKSMGSGTDGFLTNHIAHVVCRQLGYSSGTSYMTTTASMLGEMLITSL